MSNKGINTANLDPCTDPRQDFYQYATGGWRAEHPLTGEFASFGTFSLLNENARKQLRELIENLKDSPDAHIKDTIAQKVGDLYTMGMDMERRNSEGATPILPLLEHIDKTTEEGIPELLAWMIMGIDQPFFSIGVGPDLENSDMNIVHFGETGLVLGDRDYYLEDNEHNLKIRDAYHTFVKRLMALAGYDEASQERVWNNVITLETEIARHKKTREERRDPLKRFNVRPVSKVFADYPNLHLDRIATAAGIDFHDKSNVSSPAFLEFVNDWLPTLSLQTIKDFLSFLVVNHSTGVLSDDFYDADFELSKVMTGREEQRPQWKRAMSVPESMFGEAIGQLYVEKFFPPQNKQYMLGLVENLRKSLGKHIESLTWMSNETKQKALEKLAAMRVKIGYPDKWKDYKEIHIDPSLSYQANVLAASRWFTADAYSKIGKPVDKEEWMMYPQTVNAYYAPLENEICFPAGILQPPYFDVNADDALNYGAIGVVIGHEMTHGFDDSGRHYDLSGNLKNWWSEQDEERFKQLTQILVKQFDAVEVAPGVHANGTFTLGENIADQGGLRVALTAYRDNCQESFSSTIGEFNALQRFMLSYAGVWANNIRSEEILDRTKSDPHSLGRNRVNVTLPNIDEFYEAFDIKAGDKMFRPAEERVIIW